MKGGERAGGWREAEEAPRVAGGSGLMKGAVACTLMLASKGSMYEEGWGLDISK